MKAEFSEGLLLKQNKPRKTTLAPKKGSTREKNYFKKYQNNTSCWEHGIIKKKKKNW